MLLHIQLVAESFVRNLFGVALTSADDLFLENCFLTRSVVRHSIIFSSGISSSHSSTDSTDYGPVVDYTLQRCLQCRT